MIRRWSDLGRWLSASKPELFAAMVEAGEMTVAALSSSGAEENNG